MSFCSFVSTLSSGREGENGYSVQVRFSSPEEARKAIEELNKHELEGNTLRVSKFRLQIQTFGLVGLRWWADSIMGGPVFI